MIQLSKDQTSALEILIDWFKSVRPTSFITLGGYAGTGKTTLISQFRSEINKLDKKKKIAFVSFTGKAARVMKNKLEESESIYKNDFVGTIHSLIYSPVLNGNKEIIGWEMKDKISFDLIIIDEASMVDKQLWNDLRSFQIPLLAVGDHGQLPPIQGKFNLMENPQIKLEQIHRQAEDNPIIQISIQARKEGFIPAGKYAPTVRKISKTDDDSAYEVEELLRSYTTETLVLCGYNFMRIKLNKAIRQFNEFYAEEPQNYDRVICLRNNHKKQIFNGMLGTIESIEREDDDWYFVNILFDDEAKYSGLIYADQFNNKESLNFTDKRNQSVKGDLFDFGYALTVHKAQGSQARRVILFEERFRQMDDEMWRRWLYTAVTRAEEELYIIGE